MTGLHGVRRTGAAVLIAVSLASCVTRGPKPEEAGVPAAPAEFVPVSFLSPIHLESGAYGSLFSPESYAVWVGSDVAALKRSHAAESGEAVDPALDTLSRPFNDNFLVFECHLTSAFADTSMGYDAVGLRGADVYLLTADGRIVRPVQTMMAGPVGESHEGAIKKFERVNLVVFPRKDLHSGVPTVTSNSPATRLVIEAVRSRFYFEWASSSSPAQPASLTIEDRLRAVKVGFNEFYRKVLSGAHVFD